MYSLLSYARMMAERGRVDPYARALARVVTRESVVLDIGTGTGLFAMLACQFGARRVYAVEAADAIHVAREVAAANGWADRIEFIQAMSTRVDLPERADVLVCDAHGVLPFFGEYVPTMIDARRRLLTAEAAIVPQADTIWAAPVSAPDVYALYETPVGTSHAIDFTPLRRTMTHGWRSAEGATRLLASAQSWATIDYRTVQTPNAAGTADWTIAHADTAHGVLMWFDSTLADGITLSNHPDLPKLVYGRGFFPWPEPVALAEGDRVRVDIRTDLVAGDYLWQWTSVIEPQDGGDCRRFQQSTFFFAPLGIERLRRRSADARPVLGEEGHVVRAALALMDGVASVGDVAAALVRQFPGRFTDWADALAYAGDLAIQYGRR